MEEEENEISDEEFLWSLKAQLAFVEQMVGEDCQGGIVLGHLCHTKEEMIAVLREGIDMLEKEGGVDGREVQG